MTKSSTSKLEPFDPEIKRTFNNLCNLIESKLSPKKEGKEIMINLELGAYSVSHLDDAFEKEDSEEFLNLLKQALANPSSSFTPCLTKLKLECKASHHKNACLE